MQRGLSLSLLLLLLGASTLSLGAPVRGSAGTPVSQQRCAINKQRIMNAAKHYYKAFYETKLILLKLKIHRQQLVERQLRYQIYLQRLRIRHKARIQRQMLRLKTQVERTRKALRKKLASVTKRYRLPVMQSPRFRTNQQIKKTGKVFLESPLRRIRLGARKSIDDKIKKLKRSQNGMRRAIHRILTFRHRIYRIKKHQRVLSRRVQRIQGRKRMAERLIYILKVKRQRLFERLQHSKKMKASRSVVRQLAQQITRCTERIEKLRRKQARSIQMRIARTLSRLHILQRRIELLRKRESQQLLEGREMHARATRLLAKWDVYGPEQLGAILKGLSDPKDTVGFSAKSTSIVELKSKAEIGRIMKRVTGLFRRFRKLARKCLLSHRQETLINKRISNLERRRSKLWHRVQRAKGRIHHILRDRIAEIAAALDHLKTKAADVKKKKTPLFSKLHETGIAYRRALKEYKLHDFLRSLHHGLHESVKVKANIRRSQRKRVQLAKVQKRLLRRIGKTRDRISARSIKHLVKRLAHRVHRFQLKSIAKRVTRRLRRFERRLRFETRKAALIRRSKRHIRNRRKRLDRRLKRIIARARRLKRRIFAAEIKRRRLLGRVKRLRSGRQAVLQQPNDGKKQLRIRRINAWIKRDVRKIAESTSRIGTLKERRHQLKIRIRKNVAKQRRLQSRMVATRLRSQRQAKQVQRQIRKQRQFVMRVVRKRLISRRKVRRLLKRNRNRPGGKTSEPRVFKTHIEERNAQTLIHKFRRALHHFSSPILIENAVWKKHLRVSRAELAAERVFRSRVPISLRKISLIRHYLGEKLSSLNTILAQMRPAFKFLVHQEKIRQWKVERALKSHLARRVFQIRHAYLGRLNELKRNHRYQYRVHFPMHIDSEHRLTLSLEQKHK